MTKRRINTPQKPRRNSLNQKYGDPSKELRKAPRMIKASQRSEEKKDIKKQRLKLKIGSFLNK